jgi:DNA gyrase subunit A
MNGYAIRFSEKGVRDTGRSASGVTGIRLRKGDAVIGMEILGEGGADKILTVSENGYGKRTDSSFYKIQGRGGKGLTNMKVTAKTGKVKAIKKVSGGEHIMLMSSQGTAIRVQADSISLIGRATQGVRIMKLRDKDKLEDIELVEANGEEAESAEETVPEDAQEKGSGKEGGDAEEDGSEKKRDGDAEDEGDAEGKDEDDSGEGPQEAAIQETPQETEPDAPNGDAAPKEMQPEEDAAADSSR